MWGGPPRPPHGILPAAQTQSGSAPEQIPPAAVQPELVHVAGAEARPTPEAAPMDQFELKLDRLSSNWIAPAQSKKPPLFRARASCLQAGRPTPCRACRRG